ncbi:MAG: FAD-dependent oxidoreductase [Elusimicrobia bacterium]|nr:FAD-dependent oxidoreductase [Elusimicrobiota bacterium]
MNSKSVIVIGAGPGGEAAAKKLAEAGAQVTLVERAALGGLCLNWGCIPTKILLEGGRLFHQARSSAFLSGGSSVSMDWTKLQEKKRALVDLFRKALEQRFAQLRVRVMRGEARFVGDHALHVTGQEGTEELTFDAAVIATGSRPFFPPPFDRLTDDILDSDRILGLEAIPKRLVVVGGGAVGLEFACLFHELGSQVSVVEKMPQILPGEESSVSRLLQKSFEKRGMKVLTDQTVATAEKSASGWRLTLASGDVLTAEEVLVCVGRRPVTGELGLDAAGVFGDGGRIAVNNALQTSRAHIYAVGDVNGLSLLAHAASVQGAIAAGHLMDQTPVYDPTGIPRCLYTWPEVASVGEWTHSASLKDIEVKAQRFFFQGSPKAMASDETEGFLQILSEKEAAASWARKSSGPTPQNSSIFFPWRCPRNKRWSNCAELFSPIRPWRRESGRRSPDERDAPGLATTASRFPERGRSHRRTPVSGPGCSSGNSAPHGVRGSPLPQPHRLLGPGDLGLSNIGVHLYPSLFLLRRDHGPAGGCGSHRTRKTCGSGPSTHTETRGHYVPRPGRLGRSGRDPVRVLCSGSSRESAGNQYRNPHPGFSRAGRFVEHRF